MKAAASAPSFWQRRVRKPLVALFTQGVTPDKVALTIGLGFVCSLFPFLGFTTVLNLGVGLWLKLNQPILQTLNQVLGPLQLVMILVYVRMGEWLWRAQDDHFTLGEMVRVFREASFGAFLQRFGWAGVHAFTAWALSAPLLVGSLYYLLRPALRRLASKSAPARSLPQMSPWLLMLLALAGLAAIFAALYSVARRIDNYGIVDIAWSYAFGPLAICYAALADGWLPRRIAIATLATIWSARLGTHLCRRVVGHHPEEDGRYKQLRKDWAGNFAPKMFGFFQLQAASVVLLGTPFLLPTINATPHFHPLEIAGILLWAIAVGGEALADAQLAAFKRQKTSKGKVCDVGLWHYSRHPNYFFEWLGWVAYFLFALASPHGWLAIIGPASILFLLLRVSGIPLTEQQSLRSKGDAYRRYQQTTSAFVPWPPRTSS